MVIELWGGYTTMIFILHTNEAEWSSVWCPKGHSHQVAILSCLFSHWHPLLSHSVLVLAPTLLVSLSSPLPTQLCRMTCSLPQPWSHSEWLDALPTSSPELALPSTTWQLTPGLVLCCPLLARARTPTAAQGPSSVLTFHFLNILRHKRTALVCYGLSW